MAVDFGVFVPQGWRMDLVGIGDPYQQYEAMSRVGNREVRQGGHPQRRVRTCKGGTRGAVSRWLGSSTT